MSIPPVIFVDVDDTLVRSFGSKRIPISPMVELVKKLAEQGVALYCWSSGGGEYARSSAADLGLEGCFLAFLPKPNILLDDVRLHDWRLVELHPNQCSSASVEDVLAQLES
jgi:hypothetical protein